jgi:N5-(cytidine 5'-diphosphoramidyl)-L-glutamine hydrolase
MKKILVTQRVDVVSAYSERRDAIDQRWADLLISIDILPIFCPNNKDYLQALLTNQEINGVILTGGSSLKKYGGDSVERDLMEQYILSWAIESNTPVLGVCRGMQVIQDYFGVTLKVIEDHVGVRHRLNVIQGLRLSNLIEAFNDVNSFHNLGTNYSNKDLMILATSSDDIVMAIEHFDKNIFGVMWHCERESPFKEEDKELIRHIFY